MRQQPERGLHKLCVQWLELARPDILYFHCPNGEVRSKRTAARKPGGGANSTSSIAPGPSTVCCASNVMCSKSKASTFAPGSPTSFTGRTAHG